ncbi:MAG: DUF3488 and transglutaminase-like domain-containing protein [Nocardioidaceae bacterium]
MRPGSTWTPASPLPSLLAGLTTWVTLLAWTPFAENPAGFMVPLFGACALVAVSGMLLRSARLPAPVVLGLQVVLTALWLQHRLAGDAALGGLVPTPDSVRAMASAVHDAVAASRTYSAPVPVSAPEFYPLLVLTGSLTALLVDFLAVGLRRAPLAGLPLLAVYTAPVSILDGGVSWVKFAAAALCYLFLIAAGEEQRLAHWGHRLTPTNGLLDSQSAPAGRQALWSSARTIGFTATALSLVVPLLVPTLSAAWFDGGGGKGSGGGNAVSISNPMVDLRRDLAQGPDIDLVSVTTKEPEPSYLRISVLNTFDSNAWRPSGRDIPSKQRADGAVPRPPGLGSGVTSKEYAATVHATDQFRSAWLPTPYPVSAVTVSGDWRYDRTTLDFLSADGDQTTAGLTYRLRSLALSPTAAQLADPDPTPLSVSAPNTALPKDFPSSVRTLARTVTAGKTGRFEQAVALQDFFRTTGGFSYSLRRSPGNGTDDLVRFLSTGNGGRVGYCEQFAAAMAVMGRTLGIPSRVAVGFLRPEQTGPDTYTYSAHDLHAWPEMYFGGVGWVRFEPTPGSRTGRVPAYTTQQVPRAQAPTTSSAPSSAPSVNRVDKTTNAATAARDRGNGSSLSGRGALVWLAVVLLVVLLLLAPRALRSALRRRRWAEADDPRAWVEAGWAELRDTATDLAVPWDDHASPRTVAARWEESFGDPADQSDPDGRGIPRGPDINVGAARALQRLVGLLERARYARDLPAGSTTVEQVRSDVDRCVEAMAAGAGSRRRSRARWLPVSVVTSLGTRRRSGRRRPRVLAEPGVDRVQ